MPATIKVRSTKTGKGYLYDVVIYGHDGNPQATVTMTRSELKEFGAGLLTLAYEDPAVNEATEVSRASHYS